MIMKGQRQMRKIRVGFVISTLNRGGAEGKLVAVANGLDRERYEAGVYILKTGPLKELLTVPYRDNLIPNKYSIAGFAELVRSFKKDKLDIVWLVGTGDTGFFGRIAAKLAGVSHVIVSLHATDRPGKPTIDTTNRYLNEINCLTDRFVAVAETHRTHLIQTEHIDPAKIIYIHNGVDVSVFHPTIPGKDKTTEDDFGVPENVPVIGILARFKPEKRHDVFLKAGRILLQTYPDLKLMIVGDGLNRESVEKMTDDLGLRDNVIFTGGLDDVLPAIHRMTVSVLCSDTEAFPNAVLESMAAGVPVVATDVGSVREAVKNRENGMLIQKGSPEHVAEAVALLLESDTLRKSVIHEGLKTVSDRFSLRQMIRRREELFEELLNGDKRRLDSFE